MNKMINIALVSAMAVTVEFSAHGDTLCSGESAATVIDLTPGTRNAALTERIQYSTQWAEGYKPKYVALDLSGGTSATSYPVEYFDDIPGGTWSDEYKTTKLVLRYIPAGSFMMGGRDTDYPGAVNTNLHMVTLTKDFYMGVFEVTQRQWELVMGNRPSAVSNKTYYAKRPVENISYQDIRGSSNGLNWPNSMEVDAGSFIDTLRTKSGLDSFDLPTEAQWEYACRAGAETALNTGKNLSSMSNSVEMLEAGQYWEQSGWIENGYKWTADVFANAETNKATTYVGTFTPNAWGLYDMHGNVWELCLDIFSDLTFGEIDPVGPNIEYSSRVIRGGSWRHPSWACRSAHRESFRNYSEMSNVGLRLCLHGGNFIDIDTEPMFPDAIALVEIDGEEFISETGAGCVNWTPTKNGTYVLTHKVMSSDTQVGETLSATFLVTGIPKTETDTTPVPVPYVWLEPYVAEFGGSDYEAAANALSGKTQGGKATKLWEEFVAGTDPTNATSVFTAKIEMKDGEPVVTWEPNLNTNGVERLYKIHGKETLSPTEEWAYPTNSLHRFFKVTVEMP